MHGAARHAPVCRSLPVPSHPRPSQGAPRRWASRVSARRIRRRVRLRRARAAQCVRAGVCVHLCKPAGRCVIGHGCRARREEGWRTSAGRSTTRPRSMRRSPGRARWRIVGRTTSVAACAARSESEREPSGESRCGGAADRTEVSALTSDVRVSRRVLCSSIVKSIIIKLYVMREMR